MWFRGTAPRSGLFVLTPIVESKCQWLFSRLRTTRAPVGYPAWTIISVFKIAIITFPPSKLILYFNCFSLCSRWIVITPIQFNAKQANSIKTNVIFYHQIKSLSNEFFHFSTKYYMIEKKRKYYYKSLLNIYPSPFRFGLFQIMVPVLSKITMKMCKLWLIQKTLWQELHHDRWFKGYDDSQGASFFISNAVRRPRIIMLFHT